MTISAAIEYLLLSYKQATLPNLGSFKVDRQAAAVDTAHNTFSPAVSKMIFDTTDDQPDNVRVAIYLSQNSPLSLEEATVEVNVYIAELKNLLTKQGSFKIDDVGVLYTNDRGKTISFEPSSQFTQLEDSFGLESLTATPLIKEGNTLSADVFEDVNSPIISSNAETGVSTETNQLIDTSASEMEPANDQEQTIEISDAVKAINNFRENLPTADSQSDGILDAANHATGHKATHTTTASEYFNDQTSSIEGPIIDELINIDKTVIPRDNSPVLVDSGLDANGEAPDYNAASDPQEDISQVLKPKGNLGMVLILGTVAFVLLCLSGYLYLNNLNKLDQTKIETLGHDTEVAVIIDTNALPPALEPTGNVDTPAEGINHSKETKSLLNTQKQNHKSEQKQMVGRNQPKMYSIIAASFNRPDKAYAMQKKLIEKGVDAVVFDPSSDATVRNWRISINSFETLEEAKKQLPELQKGFEEKLWILK